MYEEACQELERMRKNFDVSFNHLLNETDCPTEVLNYCMSYEVSAETYHRRQAIRDYIIEKGLESHMKSIIIGMNKSNRVVLLTEDSETPHGKTVGHLEISQA